MEAEGLAVNNRPIEITVVAWLVLMTAAVRAFAFAALLMVPGVREFAGSVAGLSEAWVQVPQIVHQLVVLMAVIVLWWSRVSGCCVPGVGVPCCWPSGWPGH